MDKWKRRKKKLQQKINVEKKQQKTAQFHWNKI